MSNSNQQETQSQLKRALLAIKELRAKLDGIEQSRREPIAVVGLGCRFPGGANSPDAFWRLLARGADAIAQAPANRWDAQALYSTDVDAPGKMNTRWGGFLDDVDRFDAGFFGISPAEAIHIDPQQRLLLEVAYEALEEGGQTLEGVAGSRTGVFVGIHSHSNDYTGLQFQELTCITPHTGTGTAHSIVANRLSYVFDWHGPSLVVDTACSSALIAVHLACQSLRARECDMALASGVNLVLGPEATIAYSKLHMMAADGRCKTFDARADGFVRGEGVGVVVLKRLAEAQADGDPIWALIQGSAINQDGRTNGLTAPNGLSQEAVIRQALANGQIEPGQISYVETHGTGTALGDPVEVEALVHVFGQAASNPCFLGSVKANIGHLEAAAGIAGLIKVILALRHEQIPPQIHFQALNPHIALAGSRFVIPQQTQPWPAGETPRIAALSSFGFGGTNGHIIVREAPTRAATELSMSETAAAQAELLPLSAHSEHALRDLAHAYQSFLATTPTPLRDLCSWAGTRRSHIEHRLALVGDSAAALQERLDAFLRGETHPDVVTGVRQTDGQRGLVFVFSGQGAQWAKMGQSLLETEPVFRAQLEECDRLLRLEGAGWSLLAELQAEPSQSRLDDTEIAQPAIMALQIGLVALLRAWGVAPDAVIGHSAGEMAAAHIAGIFTLPEAIRIAYQRGRIMQRGTGLGKMAALGLAQTDVESLLAPYDGHVAVAAVNSPISTVVSGDAGAVEAIVRHAAERGLFARLLPVNYAFHSPQMTPFQAELAHALAGLTPRSAALPIYSTVSGRRGQPGDFDAHYWGRNIREPVRFAAAIAALEADGYTDFVEIGPHPVLGVPITQCLRTSSEGQATASLLREQDERTALLRTLAVVYVRGYPVAWNRLSQDRSHAVRLPAYPWQHESYWLPSKRRAGGAAHALPSSQDAPLHPLLQTRLSSPLPVFESQAGLASVPDWAVHRCRGMRLLAATAYMDLALTVGAAMLALDAAAPVLLDGLELTFPLRLTDGEPRTVQTILTLGEGKQVHIQVHSRDADAEQWQLHAAGTVAAGQTPVEEQTVEGSLAGLQEIDLTDYLAQVDTLGLGFAPNLPGLEQVWTGDHAAVGRFATAAPATENRDGVTLPAAFVDAGIQLLLAAQTGTPGRGRIDYLLTGMARGKVVGRVSRPAWVCATWRAETPAEVSGDLAFFDSAGRLLVELQGLRFTPFDLGWMQSAADTDLLYDLVWQPQPRRDPVAAVAPGAWLIFTDGQGIGARVAAQLRQQGERCTLVYLGADFAVTDAGDVRMDPAQPEAYRRVVDFAGDPLSLRGILYCWNLDAPEGTTTAQDAEALLRCTHVLYLVQALLQALPEPETDSGERAHPRLWLVTRGVHAVEGSEPLAIAQAAVWGVGRVLALEHPALWGGLVDLDPAPTDEASATLADELLASDGEDQIAFRQRRRYVARLVPSGPEGRPGNPIQIDPDAVYLITGGLGELGLQVARRLAARGVRHLVLTSRTGLPGRAAWGAAPADGRTGRRIAAVQALEAMGLTVTVAVADAADRQQMAAVLEQTAQAQRPLKGIVHCAGTLALAPLTALTAQDLRALWEPKAAGAWILHELTSERTLDFLVFFSSASAIWGAETMAAYAAANVFLDLLAHYRQGLGLPSLSVNWGWWADGGLATAALERSFGQIGLAPLQAEQALDALELALGSGAVQKTVAAVDWQIFKPIYAAKRHRPLLDQIVLEAQPPPAAPASGILQALAVASPHDQWDLLLRYVRGEGARVLGFDVNYAIDVYQGFFKLGMNSLMTVQLRSRLEADLRCTLPSTIAFEYPTIHALAGYLARHVLGIDVASRKAAQVDTTGAAGGTRAPAPNLEELAQADLLSLLDRELAAAHALVEGESR